MERRIRDSANREYLISDAPPDAPGQGVGGFSDERTAEQFLRRFMDAPLSLAVLREMLMDEALPAHRMDPATLVKHLAGRLAMGGLRLMDPDGGGAGQGAASSGGGGGGASAAPGATEDGADAVEATEEEPEKRKTLTARWSPLEAYCADPVKLLGTATNMDPNTYCSGTGSTALGGKVASRSCEGQSSFTCEWQVQGVVFSGAEAPAKQEVQGKLAAGGLEAKAPQPLVVKPVPDRPLKAVSFGRTSGKYGWTAAFRMGIKKDTLLVEQTLKITPAWLGKWVSFDQEADGRADWAFIKKDVTRWVFWDRTAGAWAPLPRGVSEYTVNNMVMVKQGETYVGREEAQFQWPEAFAEYPGYAQMKVAWLANIHSVWDEKHYLKHKDCRSGAAACCRWRIKVKVQWTDGAGDKEIYAVAAQEWERSNAKDWYLTEHREGVAAHECGHLLGAYDEYEGGAVDPGTNKIDDGTIMGAALSVARERHWDGVRDHAAQIINAAIGRSWKFEVK